MTAGAVGITSALTVRYRDIVSAMPFLLQVGVFLTPVGYPIAELGDTVRTLVELNPLTGLLEAWRWMIISGYSPSVEPIPISLARPCSSRRPDGGSSRDSKRRWPMTSEHGNGNGAYPVAVSATGLTKE